MPKGKFVPVTQDQVVAGKLRNLHERLRLTRQAMRSPTMPLYDPDFPDDAVPGQHALRDGSPRFFWNGLWHPQPIYVGAGGGAPSFESPWSGTVWFEIDWNRDTHIEGLPTGGAAGDTVFFLPEAYWPDAALFPDDVSGISRGAPPGRSISFWTVRTADGAVIFDGVIDADGGSP